MKLFEDTLIRTLIVVGLVMGGLGWAAEQSWQDLPLSQNTGNASRCRPSAVSVNRIDWSAEGEELVSLSRGGDDSLGFLTLHVPAMETSTRILMDAREAIGAMAFSR